MAALTSGFEDLAGRWPWEHVGLPLLILFTNYMKCGGKRILGTETQLCRVTAQA